MEDNGAKQTRGRGQSHEGWGLGEINEDKICIKIHTETYYLVNPFKL